MNTEIHAGPGEGLGMVTSQVPRQTRARFLLSESDGHVPSAAGGILQEHHQDGNYGSC